MAPVTRSSMHGRSTNVPQNPFASSHMAPDHRFDDGDHGDEVMRRGYDAVSDTTGAQPPYQSSAQEMLRPLQDTAERVSKQVEDFAKSMGKFVAAKDETGQRLWQDAWRLLDEYRDKAHARRQKTGSRDSQGQVQKIELESNLWSLTKDLLQPMSPDEVNNTRLHQNDSLTELHRYSPNTILWNSFLNSDDSAQQYEIILSYLQERAQAASPSVGEIIGRLTEKSEQRGLTSAAPLFTKEIIKQYKRLRAWGRPLDPSSPGLQTSLVRKSDNAYLTPQLDPDAQTRESACLVEDDEYYEEAAWQTYWELLRRGEKGSSIEKLCAEKKMFWMPVALRAAGQAPGGQADSPWLRMINIASNREWFLRCRELAKSDLPGDSKYRQAVYGLLCGDHSVSQLACRTVDDHLFSLFNSLLIERYLDYLDVYRQKLEGSTVSSYRPPSPATRKIRQFIAFAETDLTTKQDVRTPHKSIELAIVSANYDGFFIDVGRAAAHVAHRLDEGAHLMRPNTDDVPENDLAQMTAQDPDSVRIIVHLQIILRRLDLLDAAYSSNEYEMENNIANYISFLQRERMYEWIPLYASQLSTKRCIDVLGAVLIDVTEQQDREEIVRKMKRLDIDVSQVVYAIFSLANFYLTRDFMRSEAEGSLSPIPRLTFLPGHESKSVARIRPDLIDGISGDDERVISSLEWCEYYSAEEWGRACWSVALAYKIFLKSGRFGALKALLDAVSLSKVSLRAVGMNLNFSDGLENGEPASPDEMELDETPVVGSKKKSKPSRQPSTLTRVGTERNLLAEKSRTWKELEQLAQVISSLVSFQLIADGIEEHRTNSALVRAGKRELEPALETLKEAMEPLWDENFLSKPVEADEQEILLTIRNHYIPECILAYNGALYFAGHALSRGWLLECMTLAQTVAQNQMLTEAFVQSGRMRELVKAMAVDSQALLLANEKGGKKELKGHEGNMGVWEVTWRGKGMDFEAVD